MYKIPRTTAKFQYAEDFFDRFDRVGHFFDLARTRRAIITKFSTRGTSPRNFRDLGRSLGLQEIRRGTESKGFLMGSERNSRAMGEHECRSPLA